MQIQEQYLEDYDVGAQRQSFGRTVTEADVVIHAGHTGDFFPHHVDAHWAAQSEFGERIAHGTLVFAVSAGLSIDAINPAAFSYGYDGMRFVAPVRIGDTIRVDATIEQVRDNPKRPDSGFVDEVCRVLSQRDELVMIFTHIYAVTRRPAEEQR